MKLETTEQIYTLVEQDTRNILTVADLIYTLTEANDNEIITLTETVNTITETNTSKTLYVVQEVTTILTEGLQGPPGATLPFAAQPYEVLYVNSNGDGTATDSNFTYNYNSGFYALSLGVTQFGDPNGYISGMQYYLDVYGAQIGFGSLVYGPFFFLDLYGGVIYSYNGINKTYFSDALIDSDTDIEVYHYGGNTDPPRGTPGEGISNIRVYGNDAFHTLEITTSATPVPDTLIGVILYNIAMPKPGRVQVTQVYPYGPNGYQVTPSLEINSEDFYGLMSGEALEPNTTYYFNISVGY